MGRLTLLGAGVGIAFNPKSLGNLQAWYKADAGVTLNGSTVSLWADQSGNGRDMKQATSTKQPLFSSNTINGLPSLHFDGVDDTISLNTPYLAPSPHFITAFAVIKRDNNNNHGIITGTAGSFSYLQDGGSFRVGENSYVSAMTNSVWYIRSYTANNNTGTNGSSAYSNNVLIGNISGGEGSGFGILQYLGSNNAGTERFLQGYIAEILYYSGVSVLTPAQISLVNAYLNSKYAVY